MRLTFSLSNLLAFIWFAGSATAATISPFDGVWRRDWSDTSPRGVSSVGSRTVTIQTKGVSSELSTLRLTQTTSGVTKTIRIVQSCKATKTDLKADVLTIRWSELTLLSPKPSDIPRGLHLWTAPVTRTYTIRGKGLLETTHGSTDVFYRVADARPNKSLEPTAGRSVTSL